MNKIIATPSTTNELLKKYNMHAKKSYGQNFLIDSGVVDKIARNAIVSDHCCVIEIGPGIGALTQFLCKYAKKVISYEIDDRCITLLNETFCDVSHFELINQDFLTVDIASKVQQLQKEGYDVVVASNLPYYITTAILFHLFESSANIQKITVMMQKEVANRFLAKTNTKDYNALSVITQYLCNVNLLMNVPSNVFIPRPKVDSAVIQFQFRENYTQQVENQYEFFSMVKACFRQRRKTLLNNYTQYLVDKERAIKVLNRCHINPSIRSEALSLEDFLLLYKEQQNEN